MNNKQDKIEEEENPELYFSGWGFDSRKDEQNEEYGREEGGEVTVIRSGKRVWVSRPLGGYAVFRDMEDKEERAAWFLLKPLTEDQFDTSNYLDRKWFVRQWKQGKIGRCVIYAAEYMTQYQCVHLLFWPDGTGLAVDTFENPLVDFTWQEAAGALLWEELQTADPEELRPLCKSIFEAQVNPYIANAYLAPLGMSPADYKDVPHAFGCGSEKELCRLTTAIVHSHPDLFEQGRKSVTIKYRARTINKRAFMAVVFHYNAEPIPHLGRLQSLCDLALRLNTFVGETWSHWMDTPTRKGDFDKQLHKIFVEVQPPSAHERAESLLMLADWLEGKVRPEKRLRLLGVDAE